jgi:hypothetical protein
VAIKLLLELLAHFKAIALGSIFHCLTKSSAVLSHMMFTTKMNRSKVPGAQHLWILVLKKKGARSCVFFNLSRIQVYN